MANVVVEMSGDEARLWRAQQKVIAQQKKMEEGYSKAAREAKSLEKAGVRVWEQTRTPMERHERKMDELSRLYRKGAIDQETLRRAIGRSVDEMRQADTAGRRAFGGGALAEVKSFAAGFLSVGAAVAGVTTVLRNMQQVRREASEELRQSRMGMSSLAQLASTPEQMASLVGTANRVFAAGGAGSRDEAARLVFSLESAGALGEVDLFSQLRAQGLVQTPDVMARAAKTMIATMGDRETGGFRAMVSKAFGASAFSPASAESLLLGASRAGTSAATLGLSDEEVLAATAMMATATGSAEQGGTRVASLLRSLVSKGGFQGMGLQQAIAQIRSQGMSDPELIKYLGREEAIEAFNVLGDRQQFGSVLGAVRQSQTQDLVGVKLGLPGTVADLRVAMLAEQAQNRATLATTGQGRLTALADALQAQRATAIRQQGIPEFAVQLDQFIGSGYRLLDDQLYLRSFGREQQGGYANDAQLLEEIRNELRAINGNTAEAAGRIRPGGEQRATGLSE